MLSLSIVLCKDHKWTEIVFSVVPGNWIRTASCTDPGKKIIVFSQVCFRLLGLGREGWVVWETWQLPFKVLLWKQKWVLQIQDSGSEGMMHMSSNHSVSSAKSSYPKSFKYMYLEKKRKEGVSFSIYPIAQCARIDQDVSYMAVSWSMCCIIWRKAPTAGTAHMAVVREWIVYYFPSSKSVKWQSLLEIKVFGSLL